MSRLYPLLTFCLWLSSPIGPAFGLSLALQPTESTIPIENMIDVDVNMQGLLLPANPTIFGFRFEVNFDENIVSLNSIKFGPSFGNPLDTLESFTQTQLDMGKIRVTEFSRLAEADLLTRQSNNATLITLAFTGKNVGRSPLRLDLVEFFDESANSAPASSLTNASISVQSANPGPVVPEPSTILLLATGLLVMGLYRKHQSYPH